MVVGVDGSLESERALRWAVEEARLRGARLRVAYVYEHTPAWQVYGYGAEVPAVVTRETYEESAAAAEQRARTLVDGMLAGVVTGDVAVEPVVREDRRPARALVELAGDADLLVVGSRGRGGFAGLVLGSVSHQCVNHARVPVVVVPTGEDGPDEPRSS